ncbi:hypothetical protein QCA50_000587 [Cerrena zonata]|uniref:RRM domain-containing protein n=1 Tax=Cerrena zonata TaxID=2478898 RepID=A0AAW0GRC4_9APHY
MSVRGRSTSPHPLRDTDVEMDTGLNENPNAKVVIVTNLTRNVVEAHLQAIFGYYGEIIKADLPVYGKSGQNRGKAALEYVDSAAAHRAASHMNGGQLDGAILKVELSELPIRSRSRSPRAGRGRNGKGRSHSRTPSRSRSPPGRNFEEDQSETPTEHPFHAQDLAPVLVQGLLRHVEEIGSQEGDLQATKEVGQVSEEVVQSQEVIQFVQVGRVGPGRPLAHPALVLDHGLHSHLTLVTLGAEVVLVRAVVAGGAGAGTTFETAGQGLPVIDSAFFSASVTLCSLLHHIFPCMISFLAPLKK